MTSTALRYFSASVTLRLSDGGSNGVRRIDFHCPRTTRNGQRQRATRRKKIQIVELKSVAGFRSLGVEQARLALDPLRQAVAAFVPAVDQFPRRGQIGQRLGDGAG